MSELEKSLVDRYGRGYKRCRLICLLTGFLYGSLAMVISYFIYKGITG